MKRLSFLPFLFTVVKSIPQDFPGSEVPNPGQFPTDQPDAGPGASPTAGPPVTLQIDIPSQGSEGFTSTVSACGTVPPIIIEAVPTGNFTEGTFIIFLPPQASATSTTIVDPDSDQTEVLIATPLPGSCAPLELPATTDIDEITATKSDTGPSASSTACPLKGCSAGVSRVAQDIIEGINKVTLASENLQQYARQIGSRKRATDGTFAADVTSITIVTNGLKTITLDIGTLVTRIQVLSPFPPGCDSDTIVVALISFVRVHQALLNIIIGRRGLLATLPFGLIELEAAQKLAVDLDVELPTATTDIEARQFGGINPIGAIVAAVLRALESVVDSLAFAIIGLIPTRQKCLQGQKASIDGTLGDAVAAYSS